MEVVTVLVGGMVVIREQARGKEGVGELVEVIGKLIAGTELISKVGEGTGEIVRGFGFSSKLI